MRPRLAGNMAAAGLLGLALALLPLSAPGQERPGAGPAVQPIPAPPGSALDLAFFGSDRPVLLRVRVEVDGKPFVSLRDAYVKRWFDYLDRNGDGVLDRDEAKNVPGANALQQLRSNGFLFPQPNSFATLGDLDRDGDGKVTLPELVRHFDRAGFQPVQMTSAGLNQSFYNGPSEVLFKHLDVNQEGKLSKEGVRRAADLLLRKFDVDDDEVLRADELDPRLANNPFPGRIAPPLVSVPGPRAVDAFYLVRSAGADRQLGLVLLAYYDKNKDLRLSRAESGLDPEAFARLDANKDGLLDADELSRWHEQRGDVELIVRLGSKGRGQEALDLHEPGKPARLASAVSRSSEGGLRLTVGDAQVNLRPGADRVAPGRVGVSGQLYLQQFLQQFRAADTQNKGVVDLKMLAANPRLQFLRALFPLLDRNGDGKLTIAEVTAFANLIDGARDGTLSITAAAHGRALFQLLDVDRDGRLGLRELRSAWERLAPLDKNGDGFVTADEIPRQFEVTVGFGMPSAGPRFSGAVPRVVFNPEPVRARTRGPLWFRKMDRNADGDVSFREFLGTRDEFRAIDADGDGLISTEEAERYDATLRPPQGRRPPEGRRPR